MTQEPSPLDMLEGWNAWIGVSDTAERWNAAVYLTSTRGSNLEFITRGIENSGPETYDSIATVIDT